MRLACVALFLARILSAQSTIDGVIVNSVTHAGIEGVSVRFYTQKGVRYEAMTLSDGTFHIAGVEQGEYRHSIEKDGFEPPPSPDPLARESATKIHGKDPVRIEFEMSALTTLRGRVVDADGKPAASVPVQISGPRSPTEENETRSAADGAFEFHRLPPGAYTLVARPEPQKAGPVDGVRMETVATYYPSSADASQAQPINVRGTGEESGFEIRLRRVPVYRVRGIVLDEANKPALGIAVKIRLAHPTPTGRFTTSLGKTEYYLPGFVSAPLIASVTTAADGAFEFPSVPQGDWSVVANSEWQYEEKTRRDIQQTGQAGVFLAKSDVDGVEIHLSPNFEFSASVIWPTDAPSAARWAMITLLPETAGVVEPSVGMIRADGSIQFDRVYPGRYTVAPVANGISNTYVAAVQFGGRDVLGQAIDLMPNPPPMQIVYKTGAGAVRAEFEKQTSGVFVLIPAGAEGGYPRSIPCDPKGVYEFGGLRPGDYFAVGFDRVDGTKLSEPAYVSNLLTMATRIRVDENSNQLLSLSVNRWPE